MSNETAFIKKMVKALDEKGNKANILNSVLIAQSILESGWGTSAICKEGNNYHGLNWYNDSVCKNWKHFTHMTQQERNGQMVTTTEEFALCSGPGQSFSYMIQWYTKRDKYKDIIGEKDYKKVCKFLQGRYATSSQYAACLMNIIEKYNLTQYDPQEETLSDNSYGDYSGNDYYRIRTAWSNKASQIGAYQIWKNAYTHWESIKASGYHLFDKDGKQLD